MMRRLVDRLFGLVCQALVRGLNRRVEYLGRPGLRATGPRLVVVNHFNGFMDVVVIVAALGRLPRFVGKATLHKVVVARPFLRLAGVVLVQRRVDGEGTGANENAFHECHRRLAQGDCIVIFPEGTTHDRESLAPIRTGAARIALGAAAAGVTGLRVRPVGLTYGDKTRLRNDVLVEVGPAIALPPGDDEDHAAVDDLTARITHGLAVLVPGLDDPIEAWAHERSAAVAARRDGREPRLSETRPVARTTARAPEARRVAVERAIADYTLALDLAGVDDPAVAGTLRPGYASLVVRGVVTWVLAPLIVWSAIVNGPAIAILVLVDRLVSVPVTKGTVRALVAVVLFPVSWLVAGIITFDGVLPVLGVVVGEAVFVPFALWLLAGDYDALRRWVRAQRAHNARARIPDLAVRRARVVGAVRAAEAAVA